VKNTKKIHSRRKKGKRERRHIGPHRKKGKRREAKYRLVLSGGSSGDVSRWGGKEFTSPEKRKKKKGRSIAAG